MEDVVELRLPPARRRLRPAWGAVGALAAAACLCLGFFGYWQPNFVPYGTLRIQINPTWSLSVSKTDRVLDLRGLNADGEALLEGLDLKGEDSDDAVEELVERALEQGYLAPAARCPSWPAVRTTTGRSGRKPPSRPSWKPSMGTASRSTWALPAQSRRRRPSPNRRAAQPETPQPEPPAASAPASRRRNPRPPASSQARPIGDPQDDWDPTGSDYPHDSDDDDDDDDD